MLNKEIRKYAFQKFVFIESVRQDSNLRPSAPKALNNPSRTLCQKVITKKTFSFTSVKTFKSPYLLAI